MKQYTIGQFARITKLPEKTLRYYDQEGILKPVSRHHWTGYRFYDQSSVEKAKTIKKLR